LVAIARIAAAIAHPQSVDAMLAWASIGMARILGGNQKTALKMGHAIWELMDDREAASAGSADVVAVGEAYVGGAPKFKKGVKSKRGRGTGKPKALIAGDRTGQAKPTVIPNAQDATPGPIMNQWIDASSAVVTDCNTAYRKIGQRFASHHTVNHGKRQYSRPSKGAHINTVEAVNAPMQRALMGVCHRLGQHRFQRYLDEILWRWNHRQQAVKIRNQKTSSGTKTITTRIWKPISVVEQMRGLLCIAVGRQLRRTPQWGLCRP
jgi:transposase-like protein